MDRPRCPGQDMRFWKPQDIFSMPCPECGTQLEFWKDEPFLLCSGCGTEVKNPRIDLGCAKWCKFAKECLGRRPEDPSQIIPMKDRLITAMKKVFGQDQRRISHALQVLGYAEQLQKVEGGAPIIVKAAAILHDIGIPEAERKYGSAAGRYQELEGPPIARKILEELGFGSDVVTPVLDLIAHHHNGQLQTTEFNLLWDADWLVNFPEEYPNLAPDSTRERIAAIFRTTAGKTLAVTLFLKQSGTKSHSNL